MELPFALRPLLYGRSRFRLPPLRALPAGTTLRPFESRDRAVCLTIYKSNEHGRFPPDFVVFFEFWLDSGEFHKLVLCIDDVPVAVGAVSPQKRPWRTSAWLTFGMISPNYQGLGLGTALLVARLSSLPKSIRSTRLYMVNVATSQAFYSRFGFAPHGKNSSGRPGLMLPCNSALLGEREWQACRERVAALGLELPSIAVHSTRTNSPLSVGVTTAAQIAALVQLLGIIVLFAVDRPYNWLGALFVLLGLFLERLENKRRQIRNEVALRKLYGHPNGDG